LLNNISIPVDKIDNQEKINGTACYIEDMKLQGMLYAKTFRSDRVRARIKAVHIPPLPEGYFVVDKNDVPGLNRVKIILNDQPFFAEDTVNYIGQPILLVVGPDKEKILELMRGIRVDYEDIKPVLTMEDAEDGSLPPLYEGKNTFGEYRHGRGNVERCFEADRVFEAEFTTGYQEQLYLEPQGMVGVYEGGRITVYGSMQCPYYVKNALIQGFNWDEKKIRVVQTTVGGGFGGKEDYPSLLGGQVAFAAYKAKKPVQLILDRAEDIEVTPKRHPSAIRLKIALGKSAHITALQADIRLNAGAYAGMSPVVLQRTMFNIAGIYNVPNIEVKGRAVATNTVPSSAFRGFGAPQAMFAIETFMDSIAKKLGMDPLNFKLMNMAKVGDPTATGGVFRHHVPVKELVDAVDGISGYRRKTAEYTAIKDRPYRGIGMALFLHGCGFTGSGERDHINAVVKLVKRADGVVEIRVAGVDMGQGLRTTLSKIVAKALERPLDSIEYSFPDTDLVPDSGPTVASRSVMIVGKLLHDAAVNLKSIWRDGEALEVTERYKHPSFVQWEDKGTEFSGDAYPVYSWGVTAVEVEVDPLSYEIGIKGVWTAFDVGRTIDERVMRGQVEGGVLQGLGYGSIEVMACKAGRVQQRSVTDYIIPTSMDTVKIENVFIDNPYELGPFGAKGAGELTLLGAAPALAAAVSNALRVEIGKLPVTPEFLMEVAK
jgi:CO/xanthine dehydrogenase Mo-binding subunit